MTSIVIMMIMMAGTIMILKIFLIISIEICTQKGEVVLVTLWKRQGKQSPLWLSHIRHRVCDAKIWVEDDMLSHRAG